MVPAAAVETKTAVITGGSSGIGLGLVRAFLERGYNVVANSRSIDPAKLDAQGLGESRRLKLVQGDVGLPETAQRIVDAAVKSFGRIDVLVNNAGIFIAKPFTDYTEEEFHALLSTNVHGFFHLTQRVVARMLEQGSGSIVNITAAIAEQPQASVPSAIPVLAKGGLNAVTGALALELAPRGIRVNAVAPGIIKTPMFGPESYDFLSGLQPSGKMGQVSDVVDAVLFLTTASHVTGQVLHVDGGMTSGRW
jgi:NAD(P)-dependent dehydrogenase (short-subunit alcohol dehydrogenase family)